MGMEEVPDAESIRSLHTMEATERNANGQPSQTTLRGQSRRHRTLRSAYGMRKCRSGPLLVYDDEEDMACIPSQVYISRVARRRDEMETEYATLYPLHDCPRPESEHVHWCLHFHWFTTHAADSC
jgi:hypothetical protein